MFKNIDIMAKTLDISWKRNEVISNNIANTNTPNFKRSDVVFEEILHNYLKGSKLKGSVTHERHIPIGSPSNLEDLKPKVMTFDNYSGRRDGNNVDIDVEMGELAKNNILFNTIATQMNSELKRLRLVISEGRR